MKPAQRARYMWEIVEERPDASVAWYLLTSYLYYQADISLLPDEDFDRLCKVILDDWDTLEHRHKHILDVDSLRAGTGYTITDYPEIVLGAAARLAKEDGHVKWNKKMRALLKVN